MAGWPRLAQRRLAAVRPAEVQDLDGLLEHALARHLDGLAARLARN